MTKDEDFKLLKIQTHMLKVNIDCDGCREKVKKLLHKIEGVYSVSIDVEHQSVTVSGNVGSEILLRKLNRAGKHAELWSHKSSNQGHKLSQQKQQKQAAHPMNSGNNKNNKDQGKQGLMQGLKAFKNQHSKLPSFSSDDEDYDDDDEEFDDEDLRFLGDKMKQINILRQANNAAANSKKNGNGNAGGNGNNGAGKKGAGIPNQAQMKNTSGLEQKGINLGAANNRMANGVYMGGGNPSAVQGKNVMMGLHGLGGNNGSGFTGNGFSGLTGFPSNGVAFGGQHQQAPMMMNTQGYQAHPSAMMNNLRGHNNNMMMQDSRYMQPQMMYHRAPQTPSYTGYYNSYPSPYYLSNQPDNVTHLFSDENTNGCVVM